MVDSISFFILNVFVNSLLAFLTALILIEILLFLFRIQPGRAASLLRAIPIIKLPLDLCFYDFSRWSYMQGINPLCCEQGSRKLTILIGWANTLFNHCKLPLYSSIQFTSPGDRTFTISDMMGYMVAPSYLYAFAILLLLISSAFFIRKLLSYRSCSKRLYSLQHVRVPLAKKVYSPSLAAYLKKKKCTIFTTTLSGSPFVTGVFFPKVYFPEDLICRLSAKEYEAVIAHEVEHIRNYDIFIRLLLDVIVALFWWVPTTRLIRKIEEGQEIASDRQCQKYGVDSIDLAAAIYKSALHTKRNIRPIFTHCLTQHKTLKRVQLLLKSPQKSWSKLQWLMISLSFGVALPLILLGRFWIF